MKAIILTVIKFLSSFLDRKILVQDEQHKVEVATDANGRPLILEYLGEKRTMYRYKNEADMRIARSIWIKLFEDEKARKVTDEFLLEIIDKSLAHINHNQVAQVAANLIMLKDNVKNLLPAEILYKQAAILYFDQEEDLRVMDGDRHAAKLQAMRAYKDPGFFLTLLLKDLGISGDQSLEDILNYLNQSEIKVKAYQKVIRNQSNESSKASANGSG